MSSSRQGRRQRRRSNSVTPSLQSRFSCSAPDGCHTWECTVCKQPFTVSASLRTDSHSQTRLPQQRPERATPSMTKYNIQDPTLANKPASHSPTLMPYPVPSCRQRRCTPLARPFCCKCNYSPMHLPGAAHTTQPQGSSLHQVLAIQQPVLNRAQLKLAKRYSSTVVTYA